MVVLQPKRIVAVAPVGGTARWLHIGGTPGFWAHGTQKGRRMEGSRPHFHVVGLQDDAASIRPVFLPRKNQILEGTRRGGDVGHECGVNKVSEYSDAG